MRSTKVCCGQMSMLWLFCKSGEDCGGLGRRQPPSCRPAQKADLSHGQLCKARCSCNWCDRRDTGGTQGGRMVEGRRKGRATYGMFFEFEKLFIPMILHKKGNSYYDSDIPLTSLFFFLLPRKAKGISESPWATSNDRTGHVLNSSELWTHVNRQTIKFSEGSRSAA